MFGIFLDVAAGLPQAYLREIIRPLSRCASE